MKTLDEILFYFSVGGDRTKEQKQSFFKKNGELSQRGNVVYENLIQLLQDIESVTGIALDYTIRALDMIVDEPPR